jgi:hypothetical protein
MLIAALSIAITRTAVLTLLNLKNSGPMICKLTALPSQRSMQEIESEISQLRKISDSLPATNRFGFDNQTAIQAAIMVIGELQTSEEVSERYPVGSVHAYTIDAALDAAEWLYSGDVAPSCFWLEECSRNLRIKAVRSNHPAPATPPPDA